MVAAIAWLYFSQQQAFHQPLVPASPQPTISNTTASALPISEFTPESLYLLINAQRLDNKLSPLKPNRMLEQSTLYKLSDMISKKYYRHTDTTETPPWSFFRQAGYQYQLAGENLSFAINTPWQVLRGWMESPSHNEQLLNPRYTDMGIAIDCQTFSSYPDGGCIVVLHLGRQ